MSNWFLLSDEQIEQFVGEANLKLERFELGFKILKETPELTLEAFGYPKDLNQDIENKIKRARYQLWAGRFHKLATSDAVLHTNSVRALELFDREITEENVRELISYVTNARSFYESFNAILVAFGLDEFKKSMVVGTSLKSEHYNRSQLLAVYITLALLLNSDHVEYSDVLKSMRNLTTINNYMVFGEKNEIEVTMAKNGHINIKTPKKIIDVVNNIREPQAI